MRRSAISRLIIFTLLAMTVMSSLYDKEAAAQFIVLSKRVSDALPTNDPNSPLWGKASVATFPMSAQVNWDPRIFSVTVKELTVRSLNNGQDMAFMLEYKDPTQDPTDQAALEFMVGDKKSHFCMAQEMMQVPSGFLDIWVWKGEGNQGVQMKAAGFGTVAPQKTNDLTAKSFWSNGVYKVILTRPLKTNDLDDAQLNLGEFRDIAFAVWDGGHQEKLGQKAVTSYYTFKAEAPVDTSIYLYSLIAVVVVAGIEFIVVRNIRKGKQ